MCSHSIFLAWRNDCNRGFPKPCPFHWIFSQHLDLPTIVSTLWLQTDLQISALHRVSFVGYAGWKSLISHAFFSLPIQRYLGRCSGPLALCTSKQLWDCASLSTRKAKDATHNYQQVIKRSPQSGTVCFITTSLCRSYPCRTFLHLFSFVSRVNCFTSQMLKILDTSFYNVDLTWHQNYPHLRLITFQWT